MNLPRCLLAPFLTGLILVRGLAAHPAAAAERPNVLLICVDDLKPLLGCYGQTSVKSPHLDRLATRSVLFERAYCNQAVCAPSRNALLTGLRPQTLGIYDLGTNFRRARPDAITLPQHFQKHGWRTEALGKIFHVGHGNHEDPASWSVPHWKANVIAYADPANKAPEGLTREEALFANQPARNLPRGAAWEAADVPDNTYPDGALAEEAIRRLAAARESGTPFFLAVGFVKPHLPFVAPRKYWDLYDPQALPMPKLKSPPTGAPAYAPQFGGELRQYRNIPESGPISEELTRTLIHGYHAAVSYMDAQVGRVLDELDRQNLAKNTIIVLWGDHGWHLGDHGMWCKHTNYEQATRIPLMIAVPGMPGGTRTTGLVETVDLYPTLAELAGIPAPSGVDGRSVAGLLSNPASRGRDHVIHVYPRTRNGQPVLGRAVRTERYRLVEWKSMNAPNALSEWELYDYQADALETENVADRQPEVVAQLQAMLRVHPEPDPQLSARAINGAKSDRDLLFDRKDRNGDGQLTREEFLAGQPDPDAAPARFLRFDRDGNQKLSREEFVTQGQANR